MSADPSEEMPSIRRSDDAPLDDDATPISDGLGLELDTSRPSEAVLRATPIAVERGLDLTAAGSAAPGESPSLELTIDTSKTRARPHGATRAADTSSHAGLPRWLIVTLAASLVVLAAAIASVWMR